MLLKKSEVYERIKEAGLQGEDAEKAMDFLIYYGVLGVLSGGSAVYIYDVGYDIKQLNIRAKRQKENVSYSINPGFAPALGVQQTLH